ncbi:hypothetical protein TPHA_0C04230 [Tetrapisispora phaffii CBS 4417]|uniref:Sister chromatid cohesion protein PDS5 n=1 Tax=Tetrapisispora phaffii (strain ATCC 24235 / CBS 4417 / NBRC 1672 / NRRL Y-8282 / UCD 70-5) TaxID=1071381 RepID=G8BQR1_TETPH|nr:hypothetical protein TPHA_0C04230 [Tetrapisispora phaffii CBS 4417]CCE62573.1 hypothetical protein TPHA_0C04230 [Tetrapisispora phaffii CBS 4417]
MSKKVKLKFKKSILSTSDNIISTDELVNRLSILHEELSSLVQDETDPESVNSYCNDLVNRKLIKHRDAGVRAFVACCLSDILRIYAPDAPYTDTQLTDVFKLFLAQFEELGESENGYYIQQTYVITRLLEYRSIVLLTDLPSAMKLLERLFSIFYDNSKSYNPKLFKVIGGILGEVISEYEAVPTSVLKIIFNKFLTYNPSSIPKGLGTSANCGYEVTLILCESYGSRMTRYFTKYYSEVLYELTNDDENLYVDKNEISKVLDKLHNLLIKVWETVPDMIAPVTGFVYHELCSENDLFRQKSTDLVGKLLSIKSEINLVTTYQDVFNAWLSKIADISVSVRMQWVNTIPDILSVRKDISEAINKGISKTLIDSENMIRKESILLFDKLSIEVIWENITNPSIYMSLLRFSREKNREVREVCNSILAKLFEKSRKSIKRTQNNKEIWEIIDKIPSTIFDLYYINDPKINEQADDILFKYIFPLDVNDKQRVSRLLDIVSTLSGKSLTSFFAFNKRQLQISLALSKFVDFSKKVNDKEDDSSSIADAVVKLPKTINWLSSGLSDSKIAEAALNAVMELNDKRIFYLLQTCVNPDVKFSTWNNSFSELMTKLKDPNLLRHRDISSASLIIPRDIAKQFRILLYRGSPILFNSSNIPYLLSTGDTHNAALKRRLLDEISTLNPQQLKGQIKTLMSVVKSENQTSDGDMTLSLGETLKTLYKIGKTMVNDIAFDDTFFYTKLKDYASGKSPLIAKYATKLIALSPDAVGTLNELKISILPLNKKSENFTSNINVLSEIFKFYPHILDENSTDIVGYLIKEVLLSNEGILTISDSDSWIDDDAVFSEENNILNAKLSSLKLFTNKLRSITIESDHKELTTAFINKTMKLFFYLIASGGELISETKDDAHATPDNYQTRMRLCAGLQVLKCAKLPILNDFIKPADIIRLVNLVEDESLFVRKIFLDTLKKDLANEVISIKFLPLIFFIAYEPDLSVKTSTKTWINFTFGKETFRKGTYFERALPRLIHAIAHHPDIVENFNKEGDEYLNNLATAIDYLMFYFDSVANQDNFNLLYYLSERVKNYQDKIKDDRDDDDRTDAEASISMRSKRMYVIGELSQMILLQLKEKRGWQHSAYPGKLNLPGDLFQPFNTTKEAQASFKTYINEKQASRLLSNVKAKVSRIIHSSQTQKQRAQKKLLAMENQPPIKNKTKLKVKKRRYNDESDDSGSDSDINGDDDGVYKPSSKLKKVQTINARRKNLRERKEIDYNVDDDIIDENSASITNII